MSKSYIYSGSIRIAQVLLSLLSSLLIARVIGATEFGIFVYAISFLGILSTVASGGASSFVLREAPLLLKRLDYSKLQDLIISLIKITLILSILIGLLLFILYFFDVIKILGDHAAIFFAITIIVAIATSINRIIEGINISAEKVIIGQCGEKIIYPAALIILTALFSLKSELIAVEIYFLSSLSLILSLVFNIYIAKSNLRGVGFKSKLLVSLDSLESLKIYRELKYFHFLTIFGAITSQVDLIILGYFSSPSEVAIYKIGFTWAALLTFAMTAIDAVVFPKIALSFKEGALKKIEPQIKKATQLSFGFALILTVVLFLFGELMIIKFYGDQYKGAAEIIKVLCIGQLINTFTGPVHGILNLTGNEKTVTKVSILFALAACLLHSISAKFFGAEGVAITNAIILSALNISLLICTRAKTGINSCAFFKNV